MINYVELDAADSVTSSFIDLGIEKNKPLLDHMLISDYLSLDEDSSKQPIDKVNTEIEKSSQIKRDNQS